MTELDRRRRLAAKAAGAGVPLLDPGGAAHTAHTAPGGSPWITSDRDGRGSPSVRDGRVVRTRP